MRVLGISDFPEKINKGPEGEAPGVGGGGLPYETDGDARRLA